MKNDKVILYTHLTNEINATLDLIAIEAQPLPFSSSNVGQTKVVTIDYVGHQLEQLRRRLENSIRKGDL